MAHEIRSLENSLKAWKRLGFVASPSTYAPCGALWACESTFRSCPRAEIDGTRGVMAAILVAPARARGLRGAGSLWASEGRHMLVFPSVFVGFAWFSISFRLVFDGFDRVPLRFSMSSSLGGHRLAVSRPWNCAP